MIPRMRKVASIAAIVLHATLLVVLGPIGLEHEPAVLVWNGFFIAQVIVLFLLPAFANDDRPATSNSGSEPSTFTEGAGASVKSQRGQSHSRWPIAEFAVGLAVILPLGESRGLWDHWLSWGLYSPRNSRVVVEVRTSAVDRLPDLVRPLIDVDEDAPEMWSRVPIDAWSLTALGVPIYPQSRFQVGVAIALAEQAGFDREIRIVVLGMSDRFDGDRRQEVYRGLPQIRMAADRYLFNAAPRPR